MLTVSEPIGHTPRGPDASSGISQLRRQPTQVRECAASALLLSLEIHKFSHNLR
jgi:hypothetical protein